VAYEEAECAKRLLIIRQILEAKNVTDELKGKEQIAWVRLRLILFALWRIIKLMIFVLQRVGCNMKNEVEYGIFIN